MAALNVRGVVNTAVNTGGLSNKLLRGLIDGRVKCMIDQYTALATEDAGSTIKMGQVLPTGANVLAILVACSGAVASLTISVGDAGSATRYASALTSFQSAANAVWTILNCGYVVTGTSDNQVLLTTAGATLTVSQVWTCIILYSND